MTSSPHPASPIHIVPAAFPADLATVRALFLEYAQSLSINLCFQNFDQELATLPGHYAPPDGRLFLARLGDAPLGPAVGCVALRRLGEHVSEMKRLYVRPAFRRQGAGRLLAAEVLAASRRIGYHSMRLDTLASMREAIALYRSLGFREIEPYYHNPCGCAVFMELLLRQPPANHSYPY